MHVRKFMFDADKGWVPAITGIMLSPFETQEMAHFLPHLGHAYDSVLQRLNQKHLKKLRSGQLFCTYGHGCSKA